MTQQDHTNNTVPQNRRAAVYVRVAPGARTQTTQPQTNTLIALANEQGYPHEQIIVFEDVGVSTRKPLAKRDALSDLLTAIEQEGQEPEQEPIKAVYVSSEERLFRDANTVDLAFFITVCADHGVQLVTPTTTYDFTTPDQVALFQVQCEQAAHSVTEEIGKLRQPRRTRGRAIQEPTAE